MSAPDTREESEGVSLGFGLLAVAGLCYISVIAISGPVWEGVLFGGAELAVAWRVTPPSGARSLREITGMMGAVTVAWSIIWCIVS